MTIKSIKNSIYQSLVRQSPGNNANIVGTTYFSNLHSSFLQKGLSCVLKISLTPYLGIVICLKNCLEEQEPRFLGETIAMQF